MSCAIINWLKVILQFKATFIVTVAIKKLFEIRIFGCARGNFTASGRPMVFYRNIRKPALEMENVCECIDLIVPGIIKQTFKCCKI